MATPVLEEPGGYTKVGLQQKLDPRRTTASRQKMVWEIWALFWSNTFSFSVFASHLLTAMFLFLFTHPQAIEDVDEFVTSSQQIWRNVALHHLLTNGSSALQWMGAVRMRVQPADTNITITHTTPVFQSHNFLWIENMCVSNKHVNWRTGVMWSTYGLLWCFMSCLDSTVGITAEDPLVSKWCNVQFLQNKLIYILDGLRPGEYIFRIFLFWVNYSFNLFLPCFLL